MEAKQMNVEDKPLIDVHPKKRTLFFIILYCLFAFDFIARVGINAIFPVIQGDLGLSDTEVGMMGSVVLLGMGVLVLPVSFLGEKYSTKKAITLSALVWSVGTLLSGMASSFHLLLASRFMVGAGNSAYAPLSNSMITSMYSKKDWGKKIGIYNTAMTIGMALGAIVFANLANSFGWRMAFYTVGVISVILTIASLALPDPKKILAMQSATGNVKQVKEQEQAKVNIREALKVFGKNKTLLGMCMAAGLGALVVQGINSWMSIYFVREMGLPISYAATLVSVVALIAAVSYPIGGAIMDKWYLVDKRCRVFMPCICKILAVTTFGLGFYLKLIPLIFVGGFFATMGSTCYHVATQELVPSWFKSVSYGVYVLFIQLLGAVGPLLVGSLSEIFGLKTALAGTQLLSLVAAIILLILSRSYIKDFDRARQMEREARISAE